MTLEQLRKESGIKAYKIAERLKISREQYRNLEKGLYKLNNFKIEKLCEVFSKDKAEIIQTIGEANVNDR